MQLNLTEKRTALFSHFQLESFRRRSAPFLRLHYLARFVLLISLLQKNIEGRSLDPAAGFPMKNLEDGDPLGRVVFIALSFQFCKVFAF